MRLSLWAAIRARQRGADDGFTIVELMAALVVIFIAMAGLAGAVVSSLSSVSIGKERQTAALLLNRAMEQARAMPFQTLANGIPSTDTTLGTDTHLSGGSGAYTYNGEALREYTPSGTVTTPPPLYPHVSTTTLNKIIYSVYTYPTTSTTNASAVHLTVLVTWKSVAQHSLAKTLEGQTYVFSPTGCLSNGTHPFAAPCQPYFYATGTTGQTPSITITPLNSASAGISGLSFSQALLDLPVVDMDMQLEQIDRVLGLVTSSGAELSTGSTSSTGLYQLTSQTDDDPTTTTPSTSAPSWSGYSVQPLTLGSGDGNMLTLNTSGADTGTTLSTVSATGSNGCTDLGNLQQSNSAPCASGSQQDGAAATAALTLHAGDTNLGAAKIASVASSSQASQVFGTRVPKSSASSYCTGTSGDGCIHAAERRYLGTIQLGALPPRVFTDGAAPSGWSSSANYLVQLSGYTDSLSAEAGVNAAGPTASESGTLTYCSYNTNTGACNFKTLSLGSTAQTLSVGPVTVTDTKVAGGTLQVVESANLTLGGVSTTTASGSCSGTTGCVSSASANAPISGTIDYTVTYGGVTIAQLAVVVNLGGSSVSTTYKAAPSAG